MSAAPVERPILRCLLAWVGPDGQPLAFTVVDLLGVEHFMAAGWTLVALDPESQAAWHAWRDINPTAA